MKEAIRLSKSGGAKTSLIPLFRSNATLYRALDYYRPDWVHFCETLTDANGVEKNLDPFVRDQSRLKETFPEIGVMRSIPIPPEGVAPGFPTLSIASRLEPVSDLFVTDTWLGKEPVEGYIGITGRAVDWAAAGKLVLQCRIPVILAGGLSPENVFEALLKVMPRGADSCTKTNLLDERGAPVRFRKDFRKVEDFIKEVRRAERAIQLKTEEIQAALKRLRAELLERQAALPAHSVRPHQIMAIETLEEEIALKEEELKGYEDTKWISF